MAVITDNKGRAYDLDLNVQSYRRVKQDTGIDLCLLRAPGPSGQPLSAELYTSMATLLDVIWSVVRPKAQKNNISRDDFDVGMFGPKFADVRAAFMEELALFCRLIGRDEEAEMLGTFPAADTAELKKITAHLSQSGGDGATTSSNSTPENSELPTSDSLPSAS